jgi:glycosyltransferase involved in cell wall biosynthesis
VRNGLHATEFRALDPTSPAYDFVFVGEFRKLKGLEVLLQALARLRRPVRVLAAGAGPHAAWFRGAARALASALTLAPPIHPATRAFSQARCVVIPSLAESFPYVVLEAAAARMPLLATRVGGIPEIFGPYGDHLLPPGDAAALAAAMAAFLDRPAERAALAGKLQEHVRGHFGVERMVQDNIAFCRRVAGTD